jgi:hypothetical protein
MRVAALSALAAGDRIRSDRIERQSTRDEAQPADVILVLGAAEYRGRPSPVLRARLDHALELYARKLAPRIMTTGGAGGDPVFTEGGVGRDYLIEPRRALRRRLWWRRRRDHGGIHRLAGEIMRRMGLHSVIVVSDGYHIYRVKRMLQFRGLSVYGSPRKERSWRSRTIRWSVRAARSVVTLPGSAAAPASDKCRRIRGRAACGRSIGRRLRSR